MKTTRFFYLCLIILSTSVSQAQVSENTQLKEKLQHKLDSLQQVQNFPGASFAAVLPNGEKIQVASGIADSASMAPMTPDHRMLSGSNGKTFFIAAALILESNGLYDLDDLIKEFIGEEPWFHRLPNANSITMRMLMNHTSGIEEYYTLSDFMQKIKEDPSRTFQPLESISYVFDREPLFEAGSSWSYADTNYLLLGYILEKLSERKMYEIIEEHLLKPYRLSATEPSIRQQFSDLAVGYSGDHSPFPFHGAMVKNGKLVFNPQFEWAGGGFVSNPSDLSTWIKELQNLIIISEENRKEMRKKIPAKTGEDHYYGLGLQIRPSNYNYSYGHSGWFPGYVTDAAYFPEIDLAAAIQVNSDKVSVYPLLLEMVEVIQAGNL